MHRLLSVSMVAALIACGGRVPGSTDTDPSGASAPSSGSSSSGSGASSSTNADAPAACTDDLDSFRCNGDYSWCCPSTFPDCSVDAGAYEERTECPGANILVRSFGTHAIQCFYAVGSGELVGAQKQDDVDSFCNGTNYRVSGGTIPDASCAAGTTSTTCAPTEIDAGP